MNIIKSNEGVNKPFQEKIKFINRFFLDKEHPEANLGEWYPSFGLSMVFPIAIDDESQIDEIVKSIYNNLYIKLKDTILKTEKNAAIQAILYEDKKFSLDKKRLYFVIKNRTIRKTEITTLCRFYRTGNRLFIAFESYVLGLINWKKFLFFLLTFILSLFISLPFLFIPSIFLGIFMWKNVVKGLAPGNIDVKTTTTCKMN